MVTAQIFREMTKQHRQAHDSSAIVSVIRWLYNHIFDACMIGNNHLAVNIIKLNSMAGSSNRLYRLLQELIAAGFTVEYFDRNGYYKIDKDSDFISSPFNTEAQIIISWK